MNGQRAGLEGNSNEKKKSKTKKLVTTKACRRTSLKAQH